MCCLATGLAESDVPLSDKVAYSSAHEHAATVRLVVSWTKLQNQIMPQSAGNMKNTPFGCFISRQIILKYKFV